MKFGKKNHISKIPFPQGNDKSNCVLYTYMNLFNSDKEFIEFKSEQGHNLNDISNIINNTWHLWRPEGVDRHKLFQLPICCNGNDVYDGLTISQVQSSLDYWNYMDVNCEKWFSPIFVTIASKKNFYGRHQIVLFWDGKNGKNAKFILCDPHLDDFILIEHFGEIIQYYKTVMSMSVVSIINDQNDLVVLYLNKKDFKHIPFQSLNIEDN